MIAKAHNGIDGNGALEHLLRIIDEHHGGGVAAVAPAKGANAQRIDELEIIAQIAETTSG